MQDEFITDGKLVFVMGGGKFGTNALSYLKAKGAKVLVVDLNPNCIASSQVDTYADGISAYDSLEVGQSAFIKGDAVNVLAEMLDSRAPDLIVTAIPGNTIAKVIEVWLSKCGIKLEPYPKAVPTILTNIPKSLVSAVDRESSLIVVSYMPSNMICKENCLPPRNVCALTGRPKFAPIDRLLEFAVYNNVDISCILMSRQLKGGLGAIEGKDVLSMLNHLKDLMVPYTLAIGTTCNCHGILNLTKTRKLRP
jgi:hypothetical protein